MNLNKKDLDNILIESCGFLICNESDTIYKFCKTNNISSLGEFIRVYKERKDSINKLCVLDYFDGLIDLILLYYCNENVKFDDIFNKDIKIYNQKSSNYKFAYIDVIRPYYFKSALRRLGFTSNESKIIFDNVVSKGYEMKVIDAIKICKDNVDENSFRIKQNYKIFINKLNVLVDYYENKNVNDDLLIFNSNCDRITYLLNRYENLLERREKVNNDINITLNEIELLMSKISNEDIKKLVKTNRLQK